MKPVYMHDYMFEQTLDDLEASVFQKEVLENLYRIMKARKSPGLKENPNIDRDILIFYDRAFNHDTFEEIGRTYDLSIQRCIQIFNKYRRACYFIFEGKY
jgi:predicted transglutaminase-like protease